MLLWAYGSYTEINEDSISTVLNINALIDVMNASAFVHKMGTLIYKSMQINSKKKDNSILVSLKIVFKNTISFNITST